MDIYLIRHAQAAGGIMDRRGLRYAEPDPDLTETGVAQARALGERLAACGIGKTYASDLRRARRTAEILDEYLGGGFEIRSELREINMGQYEGRSAEEIERDDPVFYAEWRQHLTDLPYPGGESGADVARRCSGLIAEILGSGRPSVALVSHGGTIRILLCSFLGIGFEKRFFLCSPLANCGLSQVKYDVERGVFIVHSVNDTGHFAALVR